MRHFSKSLALLLITVIAFSIGGKKASIDKVKSSKVVKASLGRSAVLLCYYGGEPAPKVSWSKNGKLINDKCVKCAVKVNQNTPGVSKLQVIPFQEKDFGNYMCKVRNAIGFQQIKITLQTNDEEKLTQCQKDRIMSRDPRFKLEFKPRCNMDGSYHLIQCSIHLKKCWCVDNSGHKTMDAVVGRNGLHCTPKKYMPNGSSFILLVFGILMVVIVVDFLAHYHYNKGLINFVIHKRNKRLMYSKLKEKERNQSIAQEDQDGDQDGE